jgi:RNA polymerase sigma-70 factor, ECF subfamily
MQTSTSDTARNVIVDYYRSSSTRREVASGGAEALAAASGESQAPSQDDERAALQELAACMALMIRQLPPAYREAVTLADLEGASQTDAAVRASVSISGMKSRIQRGRQQLKAMLEECCRVQLDRRGTIVGYDPRKSDSCGPCGSGD